MAYDYYAVATEIAHLFDEEGYPEWSSKLINAIRAGCTSSDILTYLKITLINATDSGLSLSSSLESKISDLRSRIEIALN